jgi:hypothetical protein
MLLRIVSNDAGLSDGWVGRDWVLCMISRDPGRVFLHCSVLREEGISRDQSMMVDSRWRCTDECVPWLLQDWAETKEHVS